MVQYRQASTIQSVTKILQVINYPLHTVGKLYYPVIVHKRQENFREYFELFVNMRNSSTE
jgi:hypothetical protein